MKKMSKRILFFGNERLATGVSTIVPTLRALLAAGYDVAAVVVAQGEQGQSRRTRQLEVKQVAVEHNIPVIAPADLDEAASELASFDAKAAVLIAYGNLVPQAILDLFPVGIINVHPSLLPLHRGSTPLESVILEGAAETGVSLMRLASKMDAGPIYAQEKIELKGSETKQELADKLSVIGSKLVIEHLPAILSGSLRPTPQDEAAASYDELITKAAGQLDWSKTAVRLEREIRAYSGWPRSRARLGSTEVIITKAHVTDDSGQPGNSWIESRQLGVYASEGNLIIDSLIPSGKPEMPAAAFLAGHNLKN